MVKPVTKNRSAM